MEEARRTMKNAGIVFILSDFRAEGYEIAIRQLARKHDVVAVQIEDPSEKMMINLGTFRFVDPETGEEIEVDPAKNSFKKAFENHQQSFEQKTKNIFNVAGVEILHVNTHEDHAEKLLHFLKRRKQKR
jgi:hypothetical protein